MDSFIELIDLLKHQNPEVRVGGLSAFLQYVQHAEYLKYVEENPKKTIESLVSLMKDENGSIVKFSILCLIHLNTVNSLNFEMYKNGVIENIMNILKVDMSKLYNSIELPEILEFCLILLNNLTTDEKVSKDLLQENEKNEMLQGFYISKILTYFLDNKYKERTKWVPNILTNITRYSSGRKLLIDTSMIDLLISYLSNENEIIRFGITNTFKNLLIDEKNPEKLLNIKIHDYYFSRILKEEKLSIRKSIIESIAKLIENEKCYEILSEKQFYGVLELCIKKETNDEMKLLLNSCIERLKKNADVGQLVELEQYE
eukprot:gene4784-8370_t